MSITILGLKMSYLHGNNTHLKSKNPTVFKARSSSGQKNKRKQNQTKTKQKKKLVTRKIEGILENLMGKRIALPVNNCSTANSSVSKQLM